MCCSLVHSCVSGVSPFPPTLEFLPTEAQWALALFIFPFLPIILSGFL